MKMRKLPYHTGNASRDRETPEAALYTSICTMGGGSDGRSDND